MTAVYISLLSFSALLFHGTVMSVFSFGPFRPDMILFVLVLISLKYGSLAGVCAGFALGFMQDVYLPYSLGVNILAKSTIGYLIGFLNERHIKIDIWIRSLILILAFLLNDIVIYFLRHHHLENIGINLIYDTLPSLVYTLAIWIIVWKFLKWKGLSN